MEEIKIKIKSWVTMKAQYGMNNDSGDINTKIQFTRVMERSLPTSRIIDIALINDEMVWVTGDYKFVIHMDMISEFVVDHHDIVDELAMSALQMSKTVITMQQKEITRLKAKNKKLKHDNRLLTEEDKRNG